MFKLFEKKKKYTEVMSCVDGILIPLSDVNDEAFRSGAIGRGVAIKPTSSRICAPIDGTITMIFPTNHAFGLITPDGLEFLIHIGINTVELKGEGFKRAAYEGQKVRRGDIIAEVDFNFLDEKGYSTDTLIILTNDEAKADFQALSTYGEAVGSNEQALFNCCIK